MTLLNIPGEVLTRTLSIGRRVVLAAESAGLVAVRNAANSADAALRVGALKITGGSPAVDYALISDADGDATWQPITTSMIGDLPDIPVTGLTGGNVRGVLSRNILSTTAPGGLNPGFWQVKAQFRVKNATGNNRALTFTITYDESTFLTVTSANMASNANLRLGSFTFVFARRSSQRWGQIAWNISNTIADGSETDRGGLQDRLIDHYVSGGDSGDKGLQFGISMNGAAQDDAEMMIYGASLAVAPAPSYIYP